MSMSPPISPESKRRLDRMWMGLEQTIRRLADRQVWAALKPLTTSSGTRIAPGALPFAVPSVSLGAAAAAGSAPAVIRSDATIDAFDTTAPANLAAAAAVGVIDFAARRDHVHLDPVIAHAAAGDPHPGYATDADLSGHAAAADPHAVYQKESEKGAVNGYASLGADTLVPQDQLGTGVQDGTKFLRDDGTWQTPSGGGVTDATYVTRTAHAGLSAEVLLSAVLASELMTRWEPLTNGSDEFPEILFSDGDVVMAEVSN